LASTYAMMAGLRQVVACLLGNRLSFSQGQSRRATEETEAKRESAPTYAGCTHGGARLEKLVKDLWDRDL